MHESQKVLEQEFTFCVAGIASGLAVTTIGFANALNRLRKGEGLKARDSVIGAIGASVALVSFAKADTIVGQMESIEGCEAYTA